jgi:DNA-binding transcriptional LysR family regulator
MNLKHLPYFIAITETGSLSAAAARLGISQPTLSKYLSGLEDELQIELFYRNKKKLYLAPAGRVYFEASQRMLEIQNQANHSIKQKLYGASENICVGAAGTRGAVMIGKVYRQFVSRYPNVKLNIIELASAQQREAILNGRISMSFGGFFNMDMPGIWYIPFMVEELVLVVPVYHQLSYLAGKNPNILTKIDIDEFRDSPFVLANESTELGKASEKLFSNAGFTPTVVYRPAITSIINTVVKADMGIGVSLASYAEPCPELVYFRINSSPNVYLCALHKENYILSEPERYLLYLHMQSMASEERAGYNADRNDAVKQILSKFGPTDRVLPGYEV